MKLRDYERRAVRTLPRLLKKWGRVVAVAPTGSGKTVIAAALIALMQGKRVLWIAHRVELLKQARRHMARAGIPKRETGILSGVKRENETARILMASVLMFRTRPVPKVDLIVVDEAHRILADSYRDIIDANPDVPVLGLTATPWRLDGQGLKDVFKHLHVMAGQADMILGKHIARPVTYGIPRKKAREILRGVTSGTDFSESKLARSMMRRKLLGDVVTECARLAPGAPTLVFAVNKEHAKALFRRFRASGRRCAYLDDETTASARERMLDDLRSGVIEVIVNVDVLSEGIDIPAVKCIVLARPTKSLTRFLQQVGRASRPYKGQRPIILDHAGNVWRHRLPELDRDWTLDGKPVGYGMGAPMEKQCPHCEAMVPIGARECPECGCTIIDEKEIEEEKARLERIKAQQEQMAAARARITKIAKEKKAPSGWVEKVLEEMFKAA